MAESISETWEMIYASSSEEYMEILDPKAARTFLWRLASNGMPCEHLETAWSHLHIFAMFCTSLPEFRRIEDLCPWDYSQLLCVYCPKNFWFPPDLPTEILVEVQRGLLVTITEYCRFLIEVGVMDEPCIAQDALRRMFQEPGKMKRLRRPSGRRREDVTC